MPFREKVAWLTLVALAVSYGAYFSAVALTERTLEMPNFRLLWYFAAAMGLQVLILAVARIIMAVKSPQEARAPADERDRAIAHRSESVAYHVMMAGLVVVGVVMPFHAVGWEIVHGALSTFVIAEFVRCGVVVVSYRRDRHA